MNKIVDEVALIIENMSHKKENLIIAIDGRCASGKTTLAKELAERFDCNVFHMDDFFLRPEQRTKERLQQPGENVDYERFWEEVLLPLREGKEFSYKPYSCRNGELGEPVAVKVKAINIVEGSYSCHNNLYEYYDFRIFMTVDEEEQMKRIISRNGSDAAKIFKEKWIPMEEKYFKKFEIEKRCDYSMNIQKQNNIQRR